MPPPLPYTPPQSCEPPLHPYPRIPRDYRRSSCSPQPSTSAGITHPYARTPNENSKSSHSPQPSTSAGIEHSCPIFSDSQGSSDTEQGSSTVPCKVVLEKILSNPRVRRRLLAETSGAPPRSPSPLSQSSDSLSSYSSGEEEGEKGSSKRAARKKKGTKKRVEWAEDDEEDDEALKDPDHFIKIFTAVNGPVSKFSPKFVQTLEKYLDKVNRSPNDPKFMTTKSKYSGASAGNVDFVEAAFVVQGSSEIYGKKVDLLFNAAVSLLRVLSTPFDDLESEEEDEDGEGRTPNQRSRKGTKRPRLALENRDLAEEILEVDNFKEGKKIDQKKTVQGRFEDVIKDVIKKPIVNVRLLPPIIPRLVRKTKALANNPEDAQKFNSKRVPQFGQGLEGRGFVDEYRLNEVMRMADSMLVDHIIPVEKDQQVSGILSAIDELSESVAAVTVESMTTSQEADAEVEAVETSLEPDAAVDEAMAVPEEVDAAAEGTVSENAVAEEVAAASGGVTVPSEETPASTEETVVTDETTGAQESTGSTEETVVPIDDSTINKLSQTPVNTCDSGIDSCPSSVYNPVENNGVHDLSWEGNSSAVCVESDAISVLDDGCVSVDGGVSEAEEDSELRVSTGDRNAAESVESGIEISENERSGPESSGTLSETLRTDQESHFNDVERDGAEMDVSDTTDVLSPCEERTPQKSHPGLQEMNFTPTPKRNKRKMKSFKLPCKLSLLLPDKKKKRGSKAAELWRPSQSPCSSTSSTYPQSPMSYSAPSPDHHSLNIMLNDEDNFIPPEPLSESDNEGEFIDSGDQPQVNYWIRNREKDLMSAGQVCTLSDRVAQWQELIQPRLEANLIHGPYSHVKYAPILMELVSRKGWPCPPSSRPRNTEEEEVEVLKRLEDEHIFPIDWKKEPPVIRDKAPLEESRISFCIPYDLDFVERRECDGAWGGDTFQGFPTMKRVKRRGVVLTVDSRESDPVSSLFAALCRIYDWGFSEAERQLLRHEEEEERWRREKNTWLKSKVGIGRTGRRNWDEWTEEDDNIEVNMDMDIPSLSIEGASSSQSEPVPFTNIISGLRKEEVSRLLFTALHLASQGHMDITSSPGEINSMEVVLRSNTER